jgi:hypothetical protein
MDMRCLAISKKASRWMPHFSKVAGEMALSILAYNLTGVVEIKPLISAIAA